MELRGGVEPPISSIPTRCRADLATAAKLFKPIELALLAIPLRDGRVRGPADGAPAPTDVAAAPVWRHWPTRPAPFAQHVAVLERGVAPAGLTRPETFRDHDARLRPDDQVLGAAAWAWAVSADPCVAALACPSVLACAGDRRVRHRRMEPSPGLEPRDGRIQAACCAVEPARLKMEARPGLEPGDAALRVPCCAVEPASRRYATVAVTFLRLSGVNETNQEQRPS